MTIYVIEIPHRMPVTCWTAVDREDLIARTARAAERSDAEIAGYDDAIEYLGHDVAGLHVYESEAEAREALASPIWGGHQGGIAHDALAAELAAK